jgi:hypothetical protein
MAWPQRALYATPSAKATPHSRRSAPVIFGERHLRYLIQQFVEHYQAERYHQRIGRQLIQARAAPSNDNAPHDRMPVASRRSAQFLPSRGSVTGHDEFSDITGSWHPRGAAENATAQVDGV